MIIYNDDILITAETESFLRDHIMGVDYLLENLGLSKSQLYATQEIEFLGIMVNSITMELKLPGE